MRMRCSLLNCRQLLTRIGLIKSIALLVCGVSLAVAGVEMDRMLQQAGQRYGEAGTASVIAWRDMLTRTSSQPETTKLRQVNEFFNRKIHFGEDVDIWGKQDYWATPLEVLGRSQADCEDFAIAKYATLRLLGIPSEKMRLTYVKARIGGPQSTLVQAHMVLSYYPAPDAEPLVLDNLISDIRPASRRADLTTIFGFNAEGLWVGGATPTVANPTQRLSKWQSVLARMREEGIE
jgi:predicted transglutaminase-like cysteine proteinase